MEKKIEQVFEKLNIQIDDLDLSYFDDAKLVKDIYVSQSKEKGYMHIEVANFLPIRILSNIEKKFKNNDLVTFKLSLTVKNQILDKEIIADYLEFIKKNKAQVKGGSWHIISNDGFEYDVDENKIKFNVESNSEKESLNCELEYCSKKMQQYGFENLDYEIDVNHVSEEYWTNKEQNYKEQASKKVAEYKELQNKYSNSSTSSIFTDNGKAYKSANFVRLDQPTYESISDLEKDSQNVVIHGMVMSLDIRKTKAGRNMYTLGITDHTSSIKAMHFARGEGPTLFDELNEEDKTKPNANELKEQKVLKGDWVSIKGKYSYSDWDKDYVFMIDNFAKIEKKVTSRVDHNVEKRVELHTHTKMSAMDAVSSISDYVKLANKWNWNAIAITDHINAQAFPDAYHAIKAVNKSRDKDNQMKMIYGLEINTLNEDIWYVKNDKGQNLREAKLVVFDLETTGLSPEFDEIIEFGAVVYDYKTGERKKHDILIKPKNPLKQFTKDLTNISDEMLKNMPNIDEAFKEIREIIKDGILVAHNANFDFNFLDTLSKKLGYGPLENTVIDTLTLSRAIYPQLKNYRLGTVAKKNGIDYDDKIAHRGDYDADVLCDIYEHMWSDVRKKIDVDIDSDWNKVAPLTNEENMNLVKARGFHTTILVKNNLGLKELYKLISKSHTETFLGSPKIFKSELLKIRSNGNILLGTSCANGEIFELARTGTLEMFEAAIQEYDYIEVQPISVYKNLLQNDSLDLDELKRTIKLIIDTGIKFNKIVVATSDAHYTEPNLKMIREVYITAKGLGGRRHPLYDFKGRITDYPDQHLRTTQEMIDEFEWLNNSDLVNDIVVKNTNKIANMIDADIAPVKDGLFTPTIENVDIKLRDKCYETAHEFYGDNLPDIVVSRLEKELESITKHGFAVVYWISHLLVKKSLDDGYLVGSRGSVGSSFVATMSNITEVNPLRPHYRCTSCKYSDFTTPPEFKCGYDLPKKNCPECEQPLIGDGHDIPFETFLGFDGDKVPDIDLNFSGEYQPTAHNFTKEMFGENNVFRAGTISTVASKTAFGYVKAYFEEKYSEDNQPNYMETNRLAELAEGVKRTTGQHPGGIIILPSEYEIEDFTPVNYPADDTSSSWKTTHFDFHSIHDNLLKMDILGHVDPTALRILRDITGIDPINIPTNDERVYSLFSTTQELGVQPDQIYGETTGAIGIPEFGTQFVRAMLRDTNPKTFADLVQISGLSHGTDVYLGNAKDLIQNGQADISSVIGCRDDIMVYLMSMGMDNSLSFTIMESVRKGKGLNSKWIEEMKKCSVPDWYIDSCQKIKYMFPKAHATAYVLMAYRVAWYKVHYPTEYYATFLSTRADAFNLKVALSGYNGVLEAIKEIDERSKKEKLSKKDDDLRVVYEIMIEMYARGIKFRNIDFTKSASTRFVVDIDEEGNKWIVPPFNIIDSLGEAAAESIIKARDLKPISSVTDLKQRTQITQTQLKIFDELGITDALSSDEQLAFEF
ncbi:PolC-type DNA polymerase III [Mesoplasma photuris]|uniref:PolC-type DNA polymerase III n=1 Tax=Mesoplasma photuris TaxID=217731 RepID=UPI0004E1AB84|nr:PolC-type DNA polymerase III [Mesoplasma photuris]